MKKETIINGAVISCAIGTITVLSKLLHSSNKKYRVRKTINECYDQIEAKPKIKKDTKNKKTVEVPKKIEDFLNIIKANEYFDKNMFLNNLETLKLKHIDSYDNDTIKNINADALYDIKENSIYHDSNPKKIELFHELYHMASSHSDEDNEKYYSGFIQNLNNLTIGRGLTEGYTELLTERSLIEEELLSENYNAYIVEKKLASNLEQIVGKDKMLKFYSTADLLGLCNEMKKYTSSYEFTTYLLNLDGLVQDSMAKKQQLSIKDYTESLEFATYFLIKVYLVKMNKEYIEGNITKEEMKEDIANYINNFGLINCYQKGKILQADFLPLSKIISLAQTAAKDVGLDDIIKIKSSKQKRK